VTLDLIFHLLFRFVHIASVILFLGGLVYARWVLTPALESVPEDARIKAAAEAQRRFRSVLFTLLFLIAISGLYNFLAGPKHGSTYHIWFGIKVLLVAHITAASVLWATMPYGEVNAAGKAKYRTLSIIVSGFLVVFISVYLRSLTLRGP